jgi:hypothetical protein
MKVTPNVGVQLSWESTCFARKQAKSHKCRIWCRLRGHTRCNQPLELDRSWTERLPQVFGGSAIVRTTWLLIVGMSSQRSNLQPFGPQLSGRNCDFPQADFWPRITSELPVILPELAVGAEITSYKPTSRY